MVTGSMLAGRWGAVVIAKSYILTPVGQEREWAWQVFLKPSSPVRYFLHPSSSKATALNLSNPSQILPLLDD